MRFWTWALEAYARPGVSEACLDLQDRSGQSVPLLLWAAWAAVEGRVLDADTLGQGCGLAARWEDAAVAHLRAARRGLKPPLHGMADDTREALRAEVKALELKAEQALMHRLETMAPEPGGAALLLDDALNAAVQAWIKDAPPRAAPNGAIERLAQALG